MNKILLYTGVAFLLLTACKDTPTSQFPPGKGPPDTAGPVKVTTITEGFSFKYEKPEVPRSDEQGRQLIGTYFDTTFGLFRAKAFFNFNLPINGAFSDSFVNQRRIDSAILKIPFADGGFGNLKTVQNIRFYRLTEPILESETYSPDNTFNYTEQPIGQWTNALKNKSELRVKLNQNFIKFMKGASEAQLTNNQNFLNFFRGVAAIPQNDFFINGQGGIAYWRLLSQARIVFYQPNGVRDSILVDQRAARINTYSYDREGAFAQLNKTSNLFGLLQPPNGLKTTITLDKEEANGISKLLADGKVNIHKANFILPVSQEYHANKQPPPYIEVWADDDGDRALTDTVEFNSERQQYRVDKPRYLQELLTAIADNRPARYDELNFRIPFDPPRANGALIRGSNNPNSKGVRVKVTYSKVR